MSPSINAEWLPHTLSDLSLSVIESMTDLHTKFSGMCLQTGPNSFVFTYIFTKKRPRRRLAPPPRVGAPLYWEILDTPL